MANVEHLNVEYQGVGFRHEAEQEELTEYRSLNRWALAGVLLGLMSWLALISPLLWIVPLLAALFGVIALRQMATGPTLWTGRGLAVTGIFLACFFVSWAGAQQVSRQRIVSAKARAFADQVLELVAQGELERVHQSTLAKQSRAGAEDLKEFYRGLERDRELQAFLSVAPLPELVEAGSAAEYRFQQSRLLAQYTNAEDYEVVYQFKPTTGSSKPIVVVMRRNYDPPYPVSHWRLSRITVSR